MPKIGPALLNNDRELLSLIFAFYSEGHVIPNCVFYLTGRFKWGISIKSKETEELFQGRFSSKLPQAIQRSTAIKLEIVDYH